MDNIRIEVEENKMTIEIDLKDWKVSKSGKSDVISTNGFMAIADTEYKVGLNVIKPRK